MGAQSAPSPKPTAPPALRPGGWCRGVAGAKGGPGPAHAREPQDAPALQHHWSPAEGGPRSLDFTPAPQGWPPGSTPKRRPPESSRLRGPVAAARGPLVLPRRDRARRGKNKLSADFFFITASSPKPQTVASYSRHSIHAY